MTLFLGYDPGGKGKNGVAAIRVNGRVKVSQRAAQNVATLGLA
jgi:hypothetical protein